MEKLKGVNLGGWLVLERWISPSLFADTKARDEYSLCSQLGTETARRITAHRNGFITEDHIRRLVERGINCVRLPVGYWLFGGEPPFVDGADAYVDKCLAWASKYNLSVILDFHAAPGSQNGNDHSGQAGDINWPKTDNIIRSLEFITRLTEHYGQHSSLIAIEALNEPDWSIGPEVLVDYYAQADKIVKANCHSGVQTIAHDAFRPLEIAAALKEARLDVVLDVHLYQLFTPEDRDLNLRGHIKKARKEWKKLLKDLGRSRPVLVGEWSAVMHELYQDIDQPERHYEAKDYQKYFNAQKVAFEKAGAGWMYWTARVEGGGPWSLLDQPGWHI